MKRAAQASCTRVSKKISAGDLSWKLRRWLALLCASWQIKKRIYVNAFCLVLFSSACLVGLPVPLALSLEHVAQAEKNTLLSDLSCKLGLRQRPARQIQASKD